MGKILRADLFFLMQVIFLELWCVTAHGVFERMKIERRLMKLHVF